MNSRILITKKRIQSCKIVIIFLYFITISLILYYFNQLDRLQFDPLTIPSQWCESQPCHPFNLLGQSFILVQPLSTVLVYLLGIISISLGIFIILIQNKQKSRTWWALALTLWGLGALSAGTSYQAFSYEIKCAGNVFCTWTSLWEIFYLLLSVGSVNAMMMSQVHSSSTGAWQKFQQWYAPINMIVYSIIIVIGSVIPVRFLISFGMMILFLAPSILIFFIHNTSRSIRFKKRVDLMLLWIWLGLGIVIGAYYLYYILEWTEILWERGIWFSDNDILHIGLIGWMIYITITVKRHVVDLDESISSKLNNNGRKL